MHTVSPGYLRTALTAGNRFAMPGLLEPDDAAAAPPRRRGGGPRTHRAAAPHRLAVARAGRAARAACTTASCSAQPRKPRPGEAGATEIPGLKR
ncbi:MAG: hypothetical protein QM777_04550 [Pseudorhodoferax sp.]